MQDLIRPWRLEDKEDLALAIGNPCILANLRDGIPLPYTTADAEAFLQGVLAAPADSQYCWAIQVEGKACGSIGIFRQQNIHRRTGELGYYLAEEHWGKGIVAEAVRSACAWVFENTDLLRIYAEPFAGNTASCRVLEKVGFQFEGVLRQNAVKDGKVIDMRMYSLLREDFLK